MTIPELLLFFVAAALVYRALRPLQRRLERLFLRWVSRGGRSRRERTVIDINDHHRNN